MADDPVPTVEDRALANDALYRAVNTWAVNVKGREAVLPLSYEDARKLVDGMPALRPMVIEMEIAIARARLKECERCAVIAEEIRDQARAAGKVFDATIETTAHQIARAIRGED